MFKINNLHVAAMSATLISSLSASSLTLAQEIESQSTLEEVVVVGSQIKGASISGALPVSVFSIEDIEAIGIESGDGLLAILLKWAAMNLTKRAQPAAVLTLHGAISAPTTYAIWV